VQTKCVIISLLMSEQSVEDCKPDMLLKEKCDACKSSQDAAQPG
jgi:hypothetical protein